MIYQILVHIHSMLRWLVLLAMLVVVIRSLFLLITREQESSAGKKIPAVGLSLLHLQFLIGLILYFISPKVIFAGSSMSNSLLRFYLLEHIALMVLAVSFATIGVAGSAKILIPQKKHTRIFIFFLLSLVAILFAIPWPWRPLSAGWF